MCLFLSLIFYFLIIYTHFQNTHIFKPFILIEWMTLHLTSQFWIQDTFLFFILLVWLGQQFNICMYIVHPLVCGSENRWTAYEQRIIRNSLEVSFERYLFQLQAQPDIVGSVGLEGHDSCCTFNSFLNVLGFPLSNLKHDN